MLRSAPPGHPLQKPTVVQWDIGGMLSADGAADESVSPQSGIMHLQIVEADMQLTGRYVTSGPHCWAMWIGLTESRSAGGTDQAAGC